MKTSFRIRSLRTGWLALAAIALAPASMAAIIYQDDFNRGGVLAGSTIPLAGSTPTVTTNGATWTGGGTTSTTDGGQLSLALGENYLPFSPTAGNIYTLSYTLNPTATGPDVNINIGFMGDSPLYVATFFQEIRFAANLQIGSNAILTKVWSAGGDDDIDDPAPNSPTEYKIVLNTTGSTWTADFLWGGQPWESKNLGTPNIDRISFNQWAGNSNTGAVVTNFSLTSTAVPEPGTFLPAALIVAGALLRRRRGRAHRSGRAAA